MALKLCIITSSSYNQNPEANDNRNKLYLTNDKLRGL